MQETLPCARPRRQTARRLTTRTGAAANPWCAAMVGHCAPAPGKTRWCVSSPAATAASPMTAADTGARTSLGAVQIATRRYRGGLASYDEVLEAQQLLWPAENQLAQIRAHRLSTSAQPFKVLGGDWTRTDVEWTTGAEPGARRRCYAMETMVR